GSTSLAGKSNAAKKARATQTPSGGWCAPDCVHYGPPNPSAPPSPLRIHSRYFSKERYTMAFEVPPLPYDYNALEPYIDTQTMQLHHDKHHQAYVTNLNAALQGQSERLTSYSVDDLLRHINEVPDNIRTAVQNNGGGHANHSMFWQIMKPQGGGAPTGDLANAIQQPFGSY